MTPWKWLRIFLLLGISITLKYCLILKYLDKQDGSVSRVPAAKPDDLCFHPCDLYDEENYFSQVVL